MRIKRKFQGFLPAGKILDMFSKSKVDTYSCDKINDITHPVGSIYASETDTDPSTLFGGEWELVKQYSGGELVAYAVIPTTGGSAIANAVTTPYSDASLGTHYPHVVNYVDGIITYTAGAPLIDPKGIVGFVEADVFLSGLGGNGLAGIWWQPNANTLPTGVELLCGALNLTTGPIGYSYGGTSNKFCFKVDSEEVFYVNPAFYPYNGSFTPGAGGVYSSLTVKVFAKAGKTYVWKRVS